MGQGLPAVLAACAAEVLGVDYSDVRVLLGDTDVCPDGGPTTASRQTYVSGNAARHAAMKLKARLARSLEGEPRVSRLSGDGAPENWTAVHLAEAIARAEQAGISTEEEYEYWAPKTQPLGTGGDMHFAFGFGGQAALVRVEERTGRVDVIKVIGAHDVGRAINPLTLEGQIEGGIVMALGNALTEHYVVKDGIPWTNVMARYKIPGIHHAPEIESHIIEHATADGPYGAKGIGELSSIPTSPAITNAIFNATGVRVLSLPVDQDTLFQAMQAGQAEVEIGWGDYEAIPLRTIHAKAASRPRP